MAQQVRSCVSGLAAGLLGLAAMLGATAADAAQPAARQDPSARLRVISWRDIPFRTVVRQQYDYSCGSAAVATFLTYHTARPTTEKDAFTAMFTVGDKAKIQKSGFSLLDMKHYMATRGVQTEGYRVTLAEVERIGEPVIALITLGPYRHFVVIKGVVGGRVLVGDPALGLKIYPKAEFAKMWNGVVLALKARPSTGAPIFNLASDWSPWAPAPMGQATRTTAVAVLTNDLPPLYQISDVQITGPSVISRLP